MPTTRTILAAALLIASASTVAAQPQLTKADMSVRKALASGATSLRVIISTAASCSTSLQQSLKAHGDVVVGEQKAISAVTAVVHANHVTEFESNPCVSGVSDDAVLATHAGPKGGGGTGGTTAAVVNMLRETLGLPSTATGAGVGIAIIDSGIISNTDFEGASSGSPIS